jgi:4-hydroxybenzoate-CoA ligase
MPKGVMHVHSNPMVMAKTPASVASVIGKTTSCFLRRSYFSYGLGNAIFCPMLVGATSVFYPERPTPQTVFEMLRLPGDDVLRVYTEAAMLSDPKCTAENMSSRLRLCFSAGEPLPAAHVGRPEATIWSRHRERRRPTEMGHLFLTILRMPNTAPPAWR